MKIAFIEPSIANVEPLGIAYLAQVLINEGHEVRYFETPRGNFLKRLKRFMPDILAYSVTTGKHRLCRDLNSAIRKHINAISLFGGPHCTFCPEFIESDPLIDGICQGEGEGAFVELSRKIENKEPYYNTANWWLRINGRIYKNSIREKIENLDSLPFPNREIIYAENKDLRDIPIKRILTSRGCPFACSYCFNKRYNSIYEGKGKVYRKRSPVNITQEIKEIRRNYPITFLRIVDDIFGLDMDYDNFFETYGKQIGIPFLCNMRPNLIEEDKIKKLKAAGCVAVTIAVESGNKFVRNILLGRDLSDEVLDRALMMLKKEGIRVCAQNIIGNPGETFEMAMETFNLNVAHKVDFAECFLLTPYPGTDIYKYCVEKKYFNEAIERLPRSYWVDSPICFSSKMEKRKFVNFQKFFSFSVKHPASLPIVKFLIRLPPNILFVIFNRIYDAWQMNLVARAKFNVNNFLSAVRVNLRYVSSSFIKKGIP